jgi:hypothetical protein
MYFTTLRIGGIEFRPISKLTGAQILRDVPDTLPNEVPAETKRRSFTSHASQRHMNMRVLGTEVCHGQPLDWQAMVSPTAPSRGTVPI